MVVEMNATAQFRGLIQKELGRFGEKMTSLLKYNGNPFEPAEIVEATKSISLTTTANRPHRYESNRRQVTNHECIQRNRRGTRSTGRSSPPASNPSRPGVRAVATSAS